MNFEKTTLPWTGSPVRKVENLQHYLGDHLPGGFAKYLPRSITLFLDPEVEDLAVCSFLQEMVAWLKDELNRRMLRRDIFVDLGLFSPSEIEAFLTERTHVQPWAIYYSRSGGLGLRAVNSEQDNGERGVIPCSSMQNHGVAWSRTNAGQFQVWLATARKPGADWDWESDIGHESAHSAFAQVPLFTQMLAGMIDQSPLAPIDDLHDLGPAHVARIVYFYSEVAVVAVRGENRPTETSLPVAERAEMQALLELSHQLAPWAGFRNSLAAFTRVDGHIDVNGREIYEVACPMIRTFPHLTPFINSGTAPSISMLRQAIECSC